MSRIGLFILSLSIYFLDYELHALHVGILRHLSIEDAKTLGIDTQAEELIVEELKRRQHQVTFIHPEQFIYSTEKSQEFDAVISRAEISNFDDAVTDYYFRALDYFEAKGIPVINGAKATMLAQDKFRTLLVAKQWGVLVPETIIVSTLGDVAALKIDFPFVLKKPYGGCGKGVFLIRNQNELYETYIAHFSKGEPLLIEEYLMLEKDDASCVRDMRIWVVRDAETERAKCVGGAYRTARSGSFLTNYSHGGAVSKLEIDEALRVFSEKALDAIGADVAGIDIARDIHGKLYLIEINISFFTDKVFCEVIGKNVWKEVVDLVEKRCGVR